MSVEWQIHEAKSRLSHVVEKACSDGPQTITVHGKAKAVVLSIEEYRRLRRSVQPLSQFFQQSPLRGIALDVEGDRDLGRDVSLE